MRTLIKADGTRTPIDAPVSLDRIKQMIGAYELDVVLLADRVHVMLVDDIGLLKNLPTNDEATKLYHERCVPGTTHPICGDVVVVPDADFGG